MAARPLVRPIPWRDPFAAFAPHADTPGAALLIGGDFAILAPFPTGLIEGGFAALAAALAARPAVLPPGF